MKKSTKIISGLLATLMATSALTTAAISVNAAVTPTADDAAKYGQQLIYFEYPTDGTWGDASKVTIIPAGRPLPVHVRRSKADPMFIPTTSTAPRPSES